jgi:hypothetical protein
VKSDEAVAPEHPVEAERVAVDDERRTRAANRVDAPLDHGPALPSIVTTRSAGQAPEPHPRAWSVLGCRGVDDVDLNAAEDAAVELDVDGVVAGADATSGNVLEAVLSGDGGWLAGCQAAAGELEDLGSAAAGGAHVVDAVVDDGIGFDCAVELDGEVGRRPLRGGPLVMP